MSILIRFNLIGPVQKGPVVWSWIGGTDIADEGDWRWANGTRFNWMTSLGITQPAADGSKNCLVATTSQSFDHRNCDDRYPIICEMKSGKFEP